MKEEAISHPPIRLQPNKVDNDFSGSDIEGTNFEDELGGYSVGAEEKVDMGDAESANAYPD